MSPLSFSIHCHLVVRLGALAWEGVQVDVAVRAAAVDCAPVHLG